MLRTLRRLTEFLSLRSENVLPVPRERARRARTGAHFVCVDSSRRRTMFDLVVAGQRARVPCAEGLQGPRWTPRQSNESCHSPSRSAADRTSRCSARRGRRARSARRWSDARQTFEASASACARFHPCSSGRGSMAGRARIACRAALAAELACPPGWAAASGRRGAAAHCFQPGPSAPRAPRPFSKIAAPAAPRARPSSSAVHSPPGSWSAPRSGWTAIALDEEAAHRQPEHERPRVHRDLGAGREHDARADHGGDAAAGTDQHAARVHRGVGERDAAPTTINAGASSQRGARRSTPSLNATRK